MATLYPNATDKQICDREQAATEGQIQVNESGSLKSIVSGETVKPQSGQTNVHHSGVIMPWNDRPGKFEYPGKR